MESSLKRGVGVVLVMVILIVISSEARELRPSDHGLGYTPAGNTSEAKTFFSGGGGGEELPKAMNSNDTSSSWWELGGSEARDGGRRGHVRKVLVVVSLVCGITGVLFVASAFVYLFRHRKRSKSEGS